MAPAHSKGPDRLRRVGVLVAATTRAICATVATVDSTAPATQAARRSGDAFARDPIAPMVAVLEMKPEIAPASGKPNRAPNSRTAT